MIGFSAKSAVATAAIVVVGVVIALVFVLPRLPKKI